MVATVQHHRLHSDHIRFPWCLHSQTSLNCCFYYLFTLLPPSFSFSRLSVSTFPTACLPNKSVNWYPNGLCSQGPLAGSYRLCVLSLTIIQPDSPLWLWLPLLTGIPAVVPPPPPVSFHSDSFLPVPSYLPTYPCKYMNTQYQDLLAWQHL